MNNPPFVFDIDVDVDVDRGAGVDCKNGGGEKLNKFVFGF